MDIWILLLSGLAVSLLLSHYWHAHILLFNSSPISPPSLPISHQTDIWILLLSGLAVSLLLSRYWHAQALLDNHLHSIGLLVLAFLTGAVCSSTGVVFTPYLATLPKSYTSAHVSGVEWGEGRGEGRAGNVEEFMFKYCSIFPLFSHPSSLPSSLPSLQNYRQLARVSVAWRLPC